MAKKSERYKKVERFFDNFAEFRKAPRHKKWKEINLATRLPGWTGFKPAEDWLSQNRLRRLITSSTNAPQGELRVAFDRFLKQVEPDVASNQDLSANDRERLFRKFRDWWLRQTR